MSKNDFAKFKDQCLEQLAADTLLPAGALRVGIQIVLHLNHKTREAFPGFGRLQKLLGVGRMTVIRGVQALEEAGHIKVMRSRKGKQNEANRYRFILRQSATAQRDNARVAPTSQRGTRVVSPARLGVVSPVVPEPLILTSDLTSSLTASACADAAQREVAEGGREARQRSTSLLAKPHGPTAGNGREVHSQRPTASAQPQPPSLQARCYALARELEGDRGAALVTLALRSFPPEEIFFELNECQRHGGDIGEYLGMKAEWQR